MILSRIIPTYSLLFFEMMIFRNSIHVHDENPTWWHHGKIVQIKNTRVWETQDRIGIVRPGDSPEAIRPDYHRLKTMVKRSIEQDLGDCWQWETNGQCSEGDNCSFRHDVNKRAKLTQSNPSSNSFTHQSERKTSRTQSSRGKSPSGRMSRWPCKDYLKGTCTDSFCEKWHFPECLFYKTKSGCRLGEKCSYAHRQVDEQPSKRSKNDDKSAVATLKKYELHDRTGQPVVNRDKKSRAIGATR